MSTTGLGLLVIATGRYLAFAEQLIKDLDAVVARPDDWVVNLFSDAPPETLRALRRRHRVQVNPIPVPELRWPEASLYRYELFTRASESLAGEVLVYLDADLRILRDFSGSLRPQDWPDGMAAVRHPGFYRRPQLRPRGTWETRRRSRAYVPPWRRYRYVCGGVWMGRRDAVLSTSRELAARVHADAAAAVTARWHDESHWNWWTAHHRTHLLDPSWCWVPEYPWLSDLDPMIVAVDKGQAFQREPTPEEIRQHVVRAEPSGERP